MEIGSDLITAAFFLSSVSKTLFLAGGSFLAPDRKKHGDRLPLHRHWRVMVRIILTSGCAYSTSTVPDMISLEDVGPLHFSSCVDEDRFPSGLDEKNYRRTPFALFLFCTYAEADRSEFSDESRVFRPREHSRMKRSATGDSSEPRGEANPGDLCLRDQTFFFSFGMIILKRGTRK